MAMWIRIAAWALVIFAAPGLIYALIAGDWPGVLLNLALLTIGTLDLRSLRLLPSYPQRAWARMVWTQLTLGVVIGVSFYFVGQQMADSEYWNISRGIIENILYPIPDYLWDERVLWCQRVLTWGTAIGGVIIFLSQVKVSHKIWLRANAKPPPLP